jgi:phage terminase large subunit-like protein
MISRTELAALSDAELKRRTVDTIRRYENRGFTEWQPWTPAQTAPDGDWYGWLFLAGRGTGKTDAGSNYITEHVKGEPCISGPQPHRIAIIAPTLGDARQACVEGETGILRHDYTARFVRAPESMVKWPNGSIAHLFGVYSPEDVERLRAGGNRCLAWLEEFAAWRHLDAGYAQMQFGLRSGPQPRWIATTTGKPRRLLKQILDSDTTVTTSARTLDNPHLPQHIRDALVDRYGGTRLGRQELDGEIVEDIEGAIWTVDEIEIDRVTEAPELDAVAIGVDPPGGATECGIVAVGRKRVSGRDHFYVLNDVSLKASPNEWARQTVALYNRLEADAVVAEKNYGGDMVQAVLKQNAPNLPVKDANATRGKKVRAEPVHDLYEQHRVHHVGRLERLEDEMTTWVPESSPEPNPTDDTTDDDTVTRSKWSPNRLDALVWAITYLAGFNEPHIWFA